MFVMSMNINHIIINMINVEGIILMICCYKYQELRKKFKLKRNSYNNWKVIYLFGDPTINEEYILEDDKLIVKSEDTYLHLSNKIIKGMSYLTNFFYIKQGILKCDDDLIFNENKLLEFININNKEDYIGKNFLKQDIKNPINLSNIKEGQYTQFIINYYNKSKHQKDKDYIEQYLSSNNLTIKNLNKIPNITKHIALGHIYYLSIKSVNIIISEYKNNNYNIFSQDEESKSYPYICEDIGVGFVLFKNNIPLTLKQDIWYNPHYQHFDKPGEYLCFHTNEGNI